MSDRCGKVFQIQEDSKSQYAMLDGYMLCWMDMLTDK